MAKKAVESAPLSASMDTNTAIPIPDETIATNHPASENAASESVSASEETTSAERRSKRPRMASSEQAPNEPACLACGCAAHSADDPLMALLTCRSCHGHVHARCYSIPAEELQDLATWTCASCQEDPSSNERQCVFCLQSSGSCMRRVETAHWPTAYRPQMSNEGAWAHAMCALWDPFHVASKAPDPSNQQDQPNAATEMPVTEPLKTSAGFSQQVNASRARLGLPVPSCTYCRSADGVRIQCRCLHCSRFFHVRCAHASEKGHVEVVHAPFPLKHAYCDRHTSARHDVGAMVTKLTSKTMATLVPRDVVTKLQSIVRHIESYATLDAVLVEIMNVLEEMCKKGLKSSKTDPPTFSMRQLQALELVLDHLPQLRNVYDPSTLSKSDADLVQDVEVVHALQKAFHPQRFVRKFAGPLSQFHQCDACHEPFQERQHIFYCTSTEQTHALHWKCTKRKSAAKDRHGGSASTKKKAKAVSLVQHGHWKDVKLPKGLPSIGDGVTCGVCRAPVDARGIIGGRKEVPRMEFEKPTSDFMFGGCFANEMDPRSAAAAGLRTSRATMTTATQSVLSNGLRIPGKSAVRRSASGASAVLEPDGDASTLLGPPKMDRINVRRTTRWLACLGQAIRLVSSTRKVAQEAETMLAHDKAKGNGEADMIVTTAQGVKQVAAPEGQEERVEGPAAATTDPSVDAAVNEPVKAPTTAESEMTVASSTATEAAIVAQASPSPPESEILAAPAEARDAAAETQAENEGPAAMNALPTPSVPAVPPVSSLPPSALAYLEEAKNVVRPYDAYALSKMESAQRMLEERKGPGLSLLNTLIQEYTRFMYIKHTRAVAKASTEKRKREELEAQEERERERKRIDREAEQALKKQMLAMRKKQRT